MEQFKRRYYHSPTDLWRDVRYPFKNREQIRRAMNGDLVSFAFRERLMLAVTAVNGCRYCSYYHTGEALKAGLPEDELEKLLNGVVDGAPADELPALLYAQHWAEAGGEPETAVRQKLVDRYGAERAQAIGKDSAARDAGNAAWCEDKDQRGVARSDGQCDVGAFEFMMGDEEGNSVMLPVVIGN